MYGNLKAEMARKEIGNAEVAQIINTTEKTVRNKLSGVTEFSFFETLKIRDSLFPGWSIEELFSDEEKKVG
ncbi:transcriptional regulator [bacterium 210820-DFI.6.37]|nr:transcriptional regulator [bacterium 210820-DFI.6.37]